LRAVKWQSQIPQLHSLPTRRSSDLLVHQSPDLPVTVEDYVTAGHQVTLHGCTVREHALIGMGSIILDGAEVGEHAFIGAGSLVPDRKSTRLNSSHVSTSYAVSGLKK